MKGKNIPRKTSNMGQSKSEAAEADRYSTPQGRCQTLREFGRALKGDTVIRSNGLKAPGTDPKLLQQLIDQAKENTTRAISIRILLSDLESARRIAEKAGIGYQSVLNRAIREGLKIAG